MVEHWVIVGAGSAGCVLANRLSADPNRHVTLVDDGPDLAAGAVPPAIESPSFFDALAEPGRIHDQLMATRVAGSNPTLYRRGRGLGGSSSVNAMVALRGSTELYNEWGWHDIDAAFDRVALATETASPNEIGAVDQALLDADARTRLARLTRSGGRRVTSAEAYLWPVRNRSNLHVRCDSAVHSITLRSSVATGVSLADGSQIAADRVVMAAGAIHTPSILLRSGVDADGLGQGLQDHPSAVITLALRTGVPHDASAVAIASTLHLSIGNDLVQMLPMSHVGRTSEARGLGALLVALMTPRSRAGTVTITSGGDPVVDFALLNDPHDVGVMTQAVRLARELLNAPAFRAVVEQAFIDDRGTPLAELDSDSAIRTWLLANCGDYVHASSTCAMGTVVDQNFAVNGYRNLYVCDASVFPTIPDANTHLPTTMLAERFSARHCD